MDGFLLLVELLWEGSAPAACAVCSRFVYSITRHGWHPANSASRQNWPICDPLLGGSNTVPNNLIKKIWYLRLVRYLQGIYHDIFSNPIHPQRALVECSGVSVIVSTLGNVHCTVHW